jgi:hypothetical protein
MKISEFKKLKKKIENQNFNQEYKTINMVMLTLSYFGHIASIFLAYFMLSKILEGSINNKIAVFISSIVILGGIEILKRDIFHKFSILYLKVKSLTKDVMHLFFLSILIIGISFYASINGASEFHADSSGKDKIENKNDTLMSNQSDVIKEKYLSQIREQDSIYRSNDSKISMFAKRKRLTDIEKANMDDWKKIRDISKSEKDKLKLKMDSEIEDSNKKIKSNTEKEKEENSKNALSFIILSTLIEIVILAGVYFGEYYKFRSYREFRDKIEKDPNYQKWLLYNEILEIVYTEDTKMNQKLPSNKGIIEMCKVNDIIVMPKDMINFLKTMAGLGIIKVSGSTRYINKQRDLSFEILRKNFNIE